MTVDDDVAKVRAKINAAVTTNKGQLFVDLGGMCVCAGHLGMEGQAALVRRPLANRLTTPMTVWERVTHLDKIAWLEEFGEPMQCESCRWQEQQQREVNT